MAIGSVLPLHEVDSGREELLVHCLHALFGQGTGIFDPTVRRGLDHTSRPKPFPKLGIFGVLGVFRLLLGIEVIEIAEELVEAMVGRQELILIAEVVLPNCPVA